MLKIEKNIKPPVGNYNAKGTSKYDLILKMKVGDSILFPDKYTAANYHRIYSGIKQLLVRKQKYYLYNKNGWKIACKEDKGKIRVWRIK